MSKKTVERQICDIEGCTKEVWDSKPACPNCQRDFCLQHQAKIVYQGKELTICSDCFGELFPYWEKSTAHHKQDFTISNLLASPNITP